MKSLAKELNARTVMKNFFKSLWGMACICMAYGFLPKSLPKTKRCAYPGCIFPATGKYDYCCPEHKHLHKAGIR